MFKANMAKTCCDVRYKLVLTDLNMPRMDGFQAAQQISILQKSRPEANRVRVHAITAYDSEKVNKRCQNTGISTLLCKPVSVDALHELLDNYHYSGPV